MELGGHGHEVVNIFHSVEGFSLLQKKSERLHQILIPQWKSLSRAQVFVTLWNIHVNGPYSPWNSPGQNTEVSSLFHSSRSSRPRNAGSPAFQADSLPTKLSGKIPQRGSKTKVMGEGPINPAQLLSCVRLFVTPWTAAHQASCPSPNPWACLNSCPLSPWCQQTISFFVVPLYSCLQSYPASGSFPISQCFTSCGQSIEPSASASILPMNEYSGLIFLRIDWFDLAVQENPKSILQHHSSKASIFQCSAFFILQLSHPYMTTGKTIALTRWTFVGKVTSLLFNMLFRLVIAFLSRSKHLLVSWLQSPSAVILEPKKRKESLSLFPLFRHLFAMMWWDQMPCTPFPV